MESARVVLVTNVGQGFGRAIALAYGRGGYDVVCADPNVELATRTAAEVEELGGQAIPIQADMSSQMDVLSAYQRVTDIFGRIGGVVHCATAVSNTEFESLGEAEFFDVIVENIRSTYLVLHTSARLLQGGWIVVVAPPKGDSVQMHAVYGALLQMVIAFKNRYVFPRANLVMPSRPPSDPRHDQALVRAVRFLGSSESMGVNGQITNIELPKPPRESDELLPEVRAALDETARQDGDYLPGEPEDEDAHYFDDPDDFFDDRGWEEALGLPYTAPGLRHLVSKDPERYLESLGYDDKNEGAMDLYGDLSKLETADYLDYDDDGDITKPDPPTRR